MEEKLNRTQVVQFGIKPVTKEPIPYLDFYEQKYGNQEGFYTKLNLLEVSKLSDYSKCFKLQRKQDVPYLDLDEPKQYQLYGSF